MKKIFTLLLFVCFHGYFCPAQTSSGNNRLEVVKMGYMTRELNLTPDEAQRFWPVYNNYQSEIREARSQYPDDEVAFERKVVEIKERYKGNFKKVLGNDNQRVNRVYTTDKQFNNALRNELRNRQQTQQSQGNHPAQNQFQRQDKTNNSNNRSNTNPGNKRKPNQR
ncbi:hypothetical protein [Parafilimonas sp.]|uniref:hypothetical protein n=1 Tax=Parafilimonas sp. TaxID=1969739 RepID=UPI0039E45838